MGKKQASKQASKQIKVAISIQHSLNPLGASFPQKTMGGTYGVQGGLYTYNRANKGKTKTKVANKSLRGWPDPGSGDWVG